MKFQKILLSCSIALFCSLSFAQSWPERPVKIVIGLPPGGGGDTAARIIANELEKQLGQPFVVENKPGAGGIIASQSLARAKPDGYNILMVTDFYAINAALNDEDLLQTSLPYDTFSDFRAVGRIVNMQIMLMASSKFPAKTLKEIIATAKNNPGEVTAAHLGLASPHYVAMRLLQNRSETSFLEVPYQGSGPATTALMSGEVNLAFTGVGAGMQLASSERANAIAVSGPKRDPLAPEVPTIAESGYPGYSVLSWMGLLAPAKTPDDIVTKLNQALNTVLHDSAVIEKLQAAGLQAAPSSPTEFMNVIREDSKNMREIFRSANIKLKE